VRLSPGLVVLAVLIGLPAVEIAGFVFVGSRIGAGWTVVLTFLTAAAGIVLMRRQGLSVLARIRDDLSHDRVPAEAIGDGAMILIGGILLLIPGFVTDIVGLLLLVPPVRRLVWRFAMRNVRIETATVRRPGGGPGPVVDLDASAYRDLGGRPPPQSPWRNLDGPQA
jgi:UPF0716 protein FxsA